MRIVYSRAGNLGDWIVRVGQWWGPWTHCAILDGEHVIEARAWHGVVRTPLADAMARASRFKVVDVHTPDDHAGIAWARTTVGTPYDWWGALGVFTRKREWQEDDAWYCSEHVERALVEAGMDGALARWRDGMPGITPCQSYFNRFGLAP